MGGNKHMKKNLIFLVGETATGKDTVANYLLTLGQYRKIVSNKKNEK